MQGQAEDDKKKDQEQELGVDRPRSCSDNPQPRRSGRVSFLGPDGDLQAESFELTDRAAALLFLAGLAHGGGTGVVVEGCGGEQVPGDGQDLVGHGQGPWRLQG